MVCDGFHDEAEYGFEWREYKNRRLALENETSLIHLRVFISRFWGRSFQGRPPFRIVTMKKGECDLCQIWIRVRE